MRTNVSKPPPVFVPYDIPFKNIQDMAYGTNEIVIYGMRSLPYGIISGGGNLTMVIKVDEFLKSRNLDGKVKSFSFKARKS